MAAVVSSFLVGLSLGSHYFGTLGSRRRSLAWYGVLEIGIAAWALILPWWIQLLSSTSLATMIYSIRSPVAVYALRGLVTFVLIGPACILMGGTLPLLVGFSASRASLARTTAWLYSANTLGAAAGCFVTGFYLLPRFGFEATNLGAALINAIIGVTTIVIAMMTTYSAFSHRSNQRTQQSKSYERLARSPSVLYMIAALTGCAALILEMVWARQLAVLVGGSTYVFTATLCVFLLGIAAGGVLYYIADPFRSHSNEPQAVCSTIGFICVTVASAQWTIPSLARLVGYAIPLRSSELGNGILCSATAAILEFLPALGMGLLFPTLVLVARHSSSHPSRTVGVFGAWNTAGASIGATITSPFIIPYMGASGAVVTAMSLYVAAACGVFVYAGTFHLNRKVLSVTGVAVSALAWTVMLSHSPLRTNTGKYLYGAHIGTDLSLVYFREGASCNVLVTQDPQGHMALRVNGKVDASSGGDQRMQLGCAYLSRFIRPHARSVCVIGLGSGATAGASLLFPNTSVTCCEIEPAVAEASRYFSAFNHAPWESANFNLVFDDARSYLQTTVNSFDLVISEPSNPWIAGVSSLYTVECYEAIKRRLRPGGMLAQWVQAYALKANDFNLIVRTLRHVFPHVALVRVDEFDCLLVASEAVVMPDRTNITVAQALVDSVANIRTDLVTHFGSGDVTDLLLSHLALDESGIAMLVAGSDVSGLNTDINMRLEFDAPQSLFRSETDSAKRVGIAIDEVIAASQFEHFVESWDCVAGHAAALTAPVNAILVHQGHADVRRMLDLCNGLDGDEPYFLLIERVLAHNGRPEHPVKEYRRAPSARAATSANQLGVALWRLRRYSEAVSVFKELTSWYPESANAWANLALNYHEMKQFELAATALQRAASLDPFNSFVRREKDRMFKSTKRPSAL